MPDEGDSIANTVLKAYGLLATKRKPPSRGNGTREWVPLSGIVARHENGSLDCLALA